MTAIVERQYPLTILVDMEDGDASFTAKLPANALVTAVRLVVVAAYNGSGAVTATVTDGTLAIISGVDVKAAANTMYSNTAGKFYPSGGTLTFSVADAGGDSTAGRHLAIVEYHVLNRSNEVFVA